jgi:hypothetical protein
MYIDFDLPPVIQKKLTTLTVPNPWNAGEIISLMVYIVDISIVPLGLWVLIS